MSKYQLNIADLYNICIGTVKKLLPNFLSKEKYVLHFQKLQLYLKLELKFKKIHRVLEFNQLQGLKPYVEFNTQNRVEVKQKGDEDGKLLYNLMNNVVYGSTMKKLRNRINIGLVKNKSEYLNGHQNQAVCRKKIFDNDLVAIRKSKATLKLNKPAYNGTCILDLSQVLMYRLHYDYIKNRYGLNQKYLGNLMNSIQSKNQRIGTYH